MNVTLRSGFGYWRLNQYSYGGEYKRLSVDTPAELIAGTIKIAGQIRFKLQDGTIGITEWAATGLPFDEYPDNLFQRVSHNPS